MNIWQIFEAYVLKYLMVSIYLINILVYYNVIEFDNHMICYVISLIQLRRFDIIIHFEVNLFFIIRHLIYLIFLINFFNQPSQLIFLINLY